MQKEFFDNVNKAGKQALNTAKEVNALNTSTFETVLDKQLEIANRFVALNAKQTQIVSEYKDVPSAFQAQSTLFKEFTEQAAANARETVELMNKTREAYDKLFQKSLKNAGETVKKAQASSNKAA